MAKRPTPPTTPTPSTTPTLPTATPTPVTLVPRVPPPALGPLARGAATMRDVISGRDDPSAGRDKRVDYIAACRIGRMTLTKTSVDPQSAAAGSTVTAPTVTVTDRAGNPVPGVVVRFTVVAGGGTVSGGPQTTETQTTDATGMAQVGSWKLGPSAGPNSLRVEIIGYGKAEIFEQPETFKATAT